MMKRFNKEELYELYLKSPNSCEIDWLVKEEEATIIITWTREDANNQLSDWGEFPDKQLSDEQWEGVYKKFGKIELDWETLSFVVEEVLREDER